VHLIFSINRQVRLIIIYFVNLFTDYMGELEKVKMLYSKHFFVHQTQATRICKVGCQPVTLWVAGAVFVLIFRHLFTCNTHPNIYPHFAPKACRNYRKAPASPHTTRPGGSNQDGHTCSVKAGGQKSRNCKGTWVELIEMCILLG